MADPRAPAIPDPSDDLNESVAGEEDPGAAFELAASVVVPAAGQAPTAAAPTAPGDEAPAGTPGTGEDVCRACGGTGVLNGGPCPECEGTGKLTAAIGGA